MDVLAVIHGERARAGIFGEVVRARGHRLDEWSLAWGTPLPRPLDAYGAVFVFGGAMHADQDDRHPWLREEDAFLQRLLNQHTPMLGVCLGAQLIAKACGAAVWRTDEPEVGWFDVELAAGARDDLVFSRLPERFEAFQWHFYTYGVPAGARELARSERCTQAFRLGANAWGIQFHAEVTLSQVEDWLEHEVGDEDHANMPRDLLGSTRERIDRWNELGRELCGGFVDAAERVALAA